MASHPKKVLIVVGHFSAIPQFRLTTIRNLLARGHKVHIVVTGRDIRAGENPIPDGVTVSFFGISHQTRNPFSNLKIIQNLAREIRRFRPDAILGRNAQPLAYLRWARLLSGQSSRIVALVEGLGPAEGRLVSMLWRFAFPAYEKVVLLNADDRDFLTGKAVLSDRNLVSMRQGIGVDLQRFRPEPFQASEPFRVLMISRLTEQKGVLVFISAARRLAGGGLVFDLVGDFTEDSGGHVREQVKQAAEDGVINFHGPREDVRPFLKACHLHVLPGFYREGFPVTVMEAAATGRASIVTTAPAIRHAVTEETGWKTRPKSAGAFANCIQDIVAEGTWITKGDAAAKYASSAFSRQEFDDFLIGQLLD